MTLSDRRRIDLHFPEDDPSPEARGFCNASYTGGMGPSAMIYQGMATHQSAFDISTHTGDTGYMQRKLVMFMIHLKTEENGSVTSADGSIVQFRYGGDGLAGNRVTNVGGKARFVNVDSVIDAVKLEAALARVKGVRLPEATRHFLTSFDEADLLTKRALELEMGATPYVKPDPRTPISAVMLANAELEEGLLTEISVQRRHASGQNSEIMLQRAIGAEMTVRDGV
jgi:DNA-directed RNA polymerase subunit K/omega